MKTPVTAAFLLATTAAVTFAGGVVTAAPANAAPAPYWEEIESFPNTEAGRVQCEAARAEYVDSGQYAPDDIKCMRYEVHWDLFVRV